PAASRATAVNTWAPLTARAVFQITENGIVTSSAPRLAPSNLNCTPTTATLSHAVAETVNAEPETAAPGRGAVIDTDGGVVSAGGVVVVNLKFWDVERFPAASRDSTR